MEDAKQEQVVAMAEEDLQEVLAIEHDGQPTPWSEKIFREELERSWARLVVVRKGIGHGHVVAFANFWLVADEIQLLNIVTSVLERRQGYGQRLLQYILDVAKQKQCRLVTLEVRESNEAAIALYKQFGFIGVGVRPEYYADNKENAIVMNLELVA